MICGLKPKKGNDDDDSDDIVIRMMTIVILITFCGAQCRNSMFIALEK